MKLPGGRTFSVSEKSRKRPKTKTNSLISNIEIAISVAESANRIYKEASSFYRSRRNFTTMINEDDPLYSEVHKWLISVTPNERHKNLQAVSDLAITSSTGMVSDTSESAPSSEKVKPLIMRFNDSSERKVKIEGFTIRVSLDKPDQITKEEKNYGFRPRPAEMNFIAPSYEAHLAVERLLQRLNAERSTERKPRLKMSTRWGSWDTRSDLPPRTMDSVSIPVDQKNRIIEDMQKFLDSEEKYNRLAIPWHRAYMFYGPPGTGKTSMAKALANHFKLDLWYIALGDLESESSLMELISRVTPGSILLLEDIDSVKITQDRDSADQGKINTGSLLNALDGVATPHGLITIMTTNHFETLDEALTRTGRMDMVEHIQKPTLETLKDLYKHFYGVEAVFDISEKKFVEKSYSASDFAEVMKRNMDDPKMAMYAIQEMFS